MNMILCYHEGGMFHIICIFQNNKLASAMKMATQVIVESREQQINNEDSKIFLASVC